MSSYTKLQALVPLILTTLKQTMLPKLHPLISRLCSTQFSNPNINLLVQTPSFSKHLYVKLTVKPQEVMQEPGIT